MARPTATMTAVHAPDDNANSRDAPRTWTTMIVAGDGTIPEDVLELLRSGQTEEAILSMRSLKTDSWTMQRLRLLLAAEGEAWIVTRMRDDEVIERVAHLLARRPVHGDRVQLGFDVESSEWRGTRHANVFEKETPAPTQFAPAPSPEPAKTAAEMTWIEIELLDQDGNPFSGELCRIELPDQSVRESRLDSSGRMRLDEIMPGTCRVSFPGLLEDYGQDAGAHES